MRPKGQRRLRPACRRRLHTGHRCSNSKNHLLLGSPDRGAGCRRQTERFGHAFFLMRMVWGLVTLKA
nr:MAG TPA: hypothetical protein [Caudoviricetes sp.]